MYLQCTREALIACIVRLFEKFGLTEKFKLEARLQNWVRDLAAHYNPVIFHNLAHAFNVLHLSSVMWSRIQHQNYFDDVDLLVLFVGTISHDLDHRGLGNTYFVKTKHPWALTVSGQSVMENYHLHMANLLIDKHDLFHALSPEETSRAKKTLTEMILATDLTKHFKIQSEFEMKIGKFDTKKQEDKDHFLAVIVHACDIANSALPFDHFRSWGVRIVQELEDCFQAELLLPDADKYPPAPFLAYKDKKGFYETQIGFAGYFIAPLLGAMKREWPELAFLHD